MPERILYSYRMNGITLLEAIKKCSDILENAIALLYSPDYCEFAKFDGSENLNNFEGKGINLEYQKKHIFEARIFNKTHELRWLNKSNGKGYAVLISERELSNLSNFKQESQSYLEIISQQYLLWGETTNTHPSKGWLRLSTARIGSLDVPITQSITKEQRVYLNTVEYLAEVDEFGNVSVIEERLIELEVQ